MDFDEVDIDSYYKCLDSFGCKVFSNVLKSLKNQDFPVRLNNDNCKTPSNVAPIPEDIGCRELLQTSECSRQNNSDVINDTVMLDVNELPIDIVSTNVGQQCATPQDETTVNFNSFKVPRRKRNNMESSGTGLLSLNSDSITVLPNLISEKTEKEIICLAETKSEIKKYVSRQDKMKTVDNWLHQINNKSDNIDEIELPKKRKSSEIQTRIVSDQNGKMSYEKKANSKNEPISGSHSKEKDIHNLKYLIETINGNVYDHLCEKLKIHHPEEICFTILFKEGLNQLNKDLSPKNDESYSPISMMFYIKWHNEEKYYSMQIRRISKEEKLKQKLLIQLIMSLRTRLVCFEAQETILVIIDLYKFKRSEVILTWLIIDPKICLFLLNPDDAPQTFSEILHKLSIDFEPQNQTPQIDCAHLLNFLSKASYIAYNQLQLNNLWELYINLEIFITPILAIMEIHGIHINTKTFNENSTLLKNYLDELEKQIFQLSGEEFIINSPIQVANILYEKLKLDSKYNINIEETKSSKFKSTSEANLKKLTPFHPLPSFILEYRQFSKAKAAFVDSILKQSLSGTIRSKWDQTSAATGRITSSNPNLQAIPKEITNISHLFDDLCVSANSHLENFLSVNLRDGFIARPLHTLIAADFQNIECRIFAHLSNDPNLIELFKSDVDIFDVLSRKWLNKQSSDEVLPIERIKTKKLVYALMYGAGYKKICEILKKDYKEVSNIVSKFYEFFPGLKLFGSNILEKCRRKNNTLKSILGRKRYFDNINSTNPTIRKQTERQAINFVIQGSAVDICKKTMIVFEQYCAKYSYTIEYNLLLQIHDELVWEVPDDAVYLFSDAIKEVTNHIDNFFEGISVPFPVLLKTGKSWGSMETIHN